MRIGPLACLTLLLICWSEQSAVAQERRQNEALAGNEKVAEVMRTFAPRGVQSDGSEPTPPLESLSSFEPKSGTAIDLVAAEPEISQPLFLSWDSRGRMWVVQYRQYQYPAGLKVVRFDQHLRAVFDRVPAPPPNHVRGEDRITVFEDTDHDGEFDTHKDVITGLNIATSVAIGHGGIWVLNPPYLLFYPDADRDDVPDSDPEVHLSGFGLQDTHSVANSLLWGPDGWLYGANGSTTAGTVSSQATPGISFEGQCIWRYHPDTKVFEIYAEGGGNTFSLEIDSKGRVFCGTNGGNTRGWYLPQGSYSRKNWGKHGPLTNPFAFGFFEAMRFEGDGRRFPQAFLIYEGGLFPKSEFDGSIIAPNAMQNLVWHSDRIPDGSTFRTIDKANLLECSDRWFRPVYAGVGPDGAVYIADWYDTRLSHVSPTDDWHKTSGRIYRVHPANWQVSQDSGTGGIDLATAEEAVLLEHLQHPNKWIRRRSALELGWRSSILPSSKARLVDLVDRQACLDALWALNLQNELTSERASAWLQHDDADIRRWVVRLLGDRRESHPKLSDLAANEPNVEVRSQLAATAKRLDAQTGLAIAAELLAHERDVSDPHLPLMIWWAIEAHCDDWDAINNFVAQPSFWNSTLSRSALMGRLMRRFAAAGTQNGIDRCEELLALAPDAASRDKLIEGFNMAFQGRVMPPLSSGLATALRDYQAARGEGGMVMAVRQGDRKACAQALQALQDSSTDGGLRIAIAKAFGEFRFQPAQDTLLRLATGRGGSNPALQRVALQTLTIFDDIAIARTLASNFDSNLPSEHDLRQTACRTLATRTAWASILVGEINAWRLRPRDVPPDVIQRLRTFSDPKIASAVEEAFGRPSTISSPDQAKEIKRLENLLSSGQGSPHAGRKLFAERCGTCHRLFGQGESIGPALDNYARGDLKFWLPAIVAPSLEIREGFQSYLALTADDQIVTGMIDARDNRSVTLRTADNRRIVITGEDLVELRAIPQSLMPEDALKDLGTQQIRDLFAFLMADAQDLTSGE